LAGKRFGVSDETGRMLRSIARLLKPEWRFELEAWGGSPGEQPN